jgi:hypothetical protein
VALELQVVVVVVFLSLSLSPRSTRGPGEFVIQLLGPAESLRPFACRRQKKTKREEGKKKKEPIPQRV